ncbi:hypothetical protein BOSP111201_05675 [Bordetella sputigena]|jgi:hypothetical protein|uniref:hypothetical protein n=1 Tax=Bordetella sputigena TaxID=1416810 RepID=UPI0039F111BB
MSAMMCLPCQSITLATPGLQAHQNLVHEGFVRPTEKRRENHREDRFRCSCCHTQWIRETDRWGMDLGFRLAPIQGGAKPQYSPAENTPRAGVRVYQVPASTPALY